MIFVRHSLAGLWPFVSLLALPVGSVCAQTLPATLPSTAPTQMQAGPGIGTGRPQGTSHSARVSCTGGTLEVDANNSSLNGILRSVARCTGLQVTGGVAEQRVFGTYGPAAPATVLATLLDGTGSNMLLLEAANGQPAQLILTPRTGGPTPPSPTTYADADADDANSSGADTNDALPQVRNAARGIANRSQPPAATGTSSGQNGASTQGVLGSPGSAVTSPPAIPQGTNNVLGSPNNRSPTASTYPTTNSVPLDSVATPSTAAPPNGIVDAPNPPAAGSDTAAALNGAPRGTPGTSNISPTATGAGGAPAGGGTQQPSGELTPEQVFQQLQQRLQQQQQQQQQEQTQPASNPQ